MKTSVMGKGFASNPPPNFYIILKRLWYNPEKSINKQNGSKTSTKI